VALEIPMLEVAVVATVRRAVLRLLPMVEQEVVVVVEATPVLVVMVRTTKVEEEEVLEAIVDREGLVEMVVTEL